MIGYSSTLLLSIIRSVLLKILISTLTAHCYLFLSPSWALYCWPGRRLCPWWAGSSVSWWSSRSAPSVCGFPSEYLCPPPLSLPTNHTSSIHWNSKRHERWPNVLILPHLMAERSIYRALECVPLIFLGPEWIPHRCECQLSISEPELQCPAPGEDDSRPHIV